MSAYTLSILKYHWKQSPCRTYPLNHRPPSVLVQQCLRLLYVSLKVNGGLLGWLPIPRKEQTNSWFVTYAMFILGLNLDLGLCSPFRFLSLPCTLLPLKYSHLIAYKDGLFSIFIFWNDISLMSQGFMEWNVLIRTFRIIPLNAYAVYILYLCQK